MFILALFPIVYAQTSALISVFYLDNFPVFIWEQNAYSFQNYSFIGLAFYYMILIGGCLLFWQAIHRLFPLPTTELQNSRQKNLLESQWIRLGFIILSIFFVLFHCANLASTGSPIVTGIDRFTYWSEYTVLPLARTLWNQSIIFSFGLGLIYSNVNSSRVHRNLSLYLQAFIVTINILYADKFSWLIQLIFWFTLPTIASYISANKIRLGKILNYRTLIIITIATSSLFALFSSHYAEIADRNSTTILSLIIDRIFTLQGHVWWGTFNAVFHDMSWRHGHIMTELYQLFSAQESIDTGMGFLMQLVGYPPVVNSYLDSGASFTMAFPAIIIYSLGPVAAIGGILILSCITAAISSYLVRCTLSHRFISGLFALKLYFLAYMSLTMGDFSYLLGKTSATYTVGIIILEISSYILITNMNSKRINQN